MTDLEREAEQAYCLVRDLIRRYGGGPARAAQGTRVIAAFAERRVAEERERGHAAEILDALWTRLDPKPSLSRTYREFAEANSARWRALEARREREHPKKAPPPNTDGSTDDDG